jgi:hypothetical protein
VTPIKQIQTENKNRPKYQMRDYERQIWRSFIDLVIPDIFRILDQGCPFALLKCASLDLAVHSVQIASWTNLHNAVFCWQKLLFHRSCTREILKVGTILGNNLVLRSHSRKESGESGFPTKEMILNTFRSIPFGLSFLSELFVNNRTSSFRFNINL